LAFDITTTAAGCAANAFGLKVDGTQAPASIPTAVRDALGDRVYGCDICQDVCPWNRGVEKRRADDEPSVGAEPVVSLVDWLEAENAELAARYDRLYVPRNDGRWLKRNAIVALGNSGTAEQREALDPYLAGDDELLREHAEWANARMRERP
jgi:epoxyqueuosine reductase